MCFSHIWAEYMQIFQARSEQKEVCLPLLWSAAIQPVNRDEMTVMKMILDELAQIQKESRGTLGWKMYLDGVVLVVRGVVCWALPACWGGGGARCRRTTSAPPPELGSASQTASPAPAPRPAGRRYSHTAPFTRWEQSTGQDRTGSSPESRKKINQHQHGV